MSQSLFSVIPNVARLLPFSIFPKVDVVETERSVDDKGILNVSIEIYNNSCDLIRIRKIESPLAVRWFWIPQICVLGDSAPQDLSLCTEPYGIPCDIQSKEKKMLCFTFIYPNLDAKFYVKKTSYLSCSPEFELHLK